MPTRRWLLFVLLSALLAPQAIAWRPTYATTGLIAQLDSVCRSSVDASGFGTAFIIGDLAILGETGTVNVPCVIQLAPASSLTLSNSTTLTTQSLVVMEAQADSRGAGFFVESNSALLGAPNSGLLVQLRHAVDSITVKNSIVDYPLSVWLHAVGTGEPDIGGGSVDIEDSTLRSSDPTGDGVDGVASEDSGAALFARDTVVSPARGGVPVFFARTCLIDTVSGALPGCAAPSTVAATPSTGLAPSSAKQP